MRSRQGGLACESRMPLRPAAATAADPLLSRP